MRLVSVSSLAVLAMLAGCSGPATSTGTSPPVSTPPGGYSQYQLEYLVLTQFPNLFWNDPDFYPIAREGQEVANALAQFSSIRANQLEFAAVIEHLGLANKPDYTDQEKVLIYQQHKLLTLGMLFTPASQGAFSFDLRVGEGQGERIQGTITSDGKITIVKREPSFNTHPICLTEGTLIDTPDGDLAVQRIREGMLVWTVDSNGVRVAAPVIETRSTMVSTSYRALRLTLEDGRYVVASPAHPSASGEPLDSYKVGNLLDGSAITASNLTAYSGTFTYDILAAGGTGLYWANGILLRSTLMPR